MAETVNIQKGIPHVAKTAVASLEFKRQTSVNSRNEFADMLLTMRRYNAVTRDDGDGQPALANDFRQAGVINLRFLPLLATSGAKVLECACQTYL